MIYLFGCYLWNYFRKPPRARRNSTPAQRNRLKDTLNRFAREGCHPPRREIPKVTRFFRSRARRHPARDVELLKDKDSSSDDAKHLFNYTLKKHPSKLLTVFLFFSGMST